MCCIRSAAHYCALCFCRVCFLQVCTHKPACMLPCATTCRSSAAHLVRGEQHVARIWHITLRSRQHAARKSSVSVP